MMRFLFWITALLVTGKWIKELWQKRKKPGEEAKNPIPSKNADDHGEAAKQFPESFYEKELSRNSNYICSGTKERPSRIVMEYWSLAGDQFPENDPLYARD